MLRGMIGVVVVVCRVSGYCVMVDYSVVGRESLGSS